MNIAERVEEIQKTIADTSKYYHRQAGSVQLLAVSKGQSPEAIKAAFAAGLTNFGENYWQEAEQKMQELSNLPLCWHFIGPIQSNKAVVIAQHFSWVHSVSREKIAKLLSQYRPTHLPPLNLCLQVKLDPEINKAGVEPEHLLELAATIAALPGLKLRGLMAIPQPEQQQEEQYQSLLRLPLLLNQINTKLNLSLDTLSMGMSDDLHAAIRAGSTMVRIGRALFGNRPGK